MTQHNLYQELSNALGLVYDSLAIAKKGLLMNPSKEDERKLNRLILRLELERADISAAMDALLDGNDTYEGPTPEQVAEIQALLVEVDSMTSANLNASKAIQITSKILDMATKIADI